ncbi:MULTISPECIES: cytochrome b [Methylotenera]|uniref:cytochrome b n=1 Tax=Methylotenera TaxID=359407 RepID=UPI001E36BDD2|nr:MULTISPECIES: cytochrome b/b6 domain-containing protein [Methylotenera]
MNIKNTKTQYGLIARILHWTSVMLLLALIVVASQFEAMLASPEKLKLTTLHSSLGLVFFLVILARLTWRNVNHNPIKSYSIKSWQKLTAISLHRCIYIVLIAQCVAGFVMLITIGKPLQLFNLFELNPFIEKHTLLNNFALNIHFFISIMIYPLLAIHIGAAIYHQIFGLTDD